MKRYRTPSMLLLALAVIPGARSQATDQAVLQTGPASFDPAIPAQVEITRAKTGHLLVSPRINGTPAGYFIFDTGAGICVISTPFADRFGLTQAGSVESVGGGGAQLSKVLRAESISLGPATFHDQPIMVTDLSFLKQHLGVEIAGVIGYGVLAQMVAIVDPKTPTLAVHDPATFQLTDGSWSEIDLTDRIPVIPMNFEGNSGRFKLDLGANTPVTFYAPAVTRWKLLDGRELAPATTGGVGGFVTAQRGTLAWIELAGVRQAPVNATFVTEAKGVHADTRYDGQVGVTLFDPFILAFDYGRSRIGFLPRNN
jgi:hypothetical protein